jgi:hypothetical protein
MEVEAGETCDVCMCGTSWEKFTLSSSSFDASGLTFDAAFKKWRDSYACLGLDRLVSRAELVICDSCFGVLSSVDHAETTLRTQLSNLQKLLLNCDRLDTVEEQNVSVKREDYGYGVYSRYLRVA